MNNISTISFVSLMCVFQVEISGAVRGTAEWPSNLEPVAWHRGAEMVRMKLGLYHATHKVADGEVEYKNISIEGPNGIIRTSPIPERDSTTTSYTSRAIDVCENYDPLTVRCIPYPRELLCYSRASMDS